MEHVGREGGLGQTNFDHEEKDAVRIGTEVSGLLFHAVKLIPVDSSSRGREVILNI